MYLGNIVLGFAHSVAQLQYLAFCMAIHSASINVAALLELGDEPLHDLLELILIGFEQHCVN